MLEDADEVALLYVELKHHHRGLAPSHPRYSVPDDDWHATARGALGDRNVTVLVAEADDAVVGFVKLGLAQKSWGLACEIDTLVVAANARNKGVGSRLMTAAEAFGRTAGASAMRVNVLVHNRRAQGFYERSGYEPFALRLGKALD